MLPEIGRTPSPVPRGMLAMPRRAASRPAQIAAMTSDIENRLLPPPFRMPCFVRRYKNTADRVIGGVLGMVDSVLSLPAGCHKGGQTWEFVAMAGNRWNPISREVYATFSVFAGDLRSSPNRISTRNLSSRFERAERFSGSRTRALYS